MPGRAGPPGSVTAGKSGGPSTLPSLKSQRVPFGAGRPSRVELHPGPSCPWSLLLELPVTVQSPDPGRALSTHTSSACFLTISFWFDYVPSPRERHLPCGFLSSSLLARVLASLSLLGAQQ